MQIKKLKLENFRGIQKQEIELLPNMNVFVGINGAGKSTILDAIAISLSWLVNRIQRAEAKGMTIPDDSIKNETNYSSVTLDILENNQIYSWKNIEFSRGYPKKERSNLLRISELAYFYQEEYQRVNKLPMIAYYPINRIAKGISPKIRGRESVSQLDVYDNALGSKANFQAFFEWFRLQDDIINEQSQSKIKWMKEHKAWIMSKVSKIFNSIPSPHRNSRELSYLKNKMSLDDYLLEEPRYLFRELIHSTHSLNFEFFKDNNIMNNLDEFEYLLYQINKPSYNDEQEVLFEEQIVHYVKEIIYLIYPMNDNRLNHSLIRFMWNMFSLSLQLFFWKLTERGKNDIENLFETYHPLRGQNRKVLNKEQRVQKFIEAIHEALLNDKQRQKQVLVNPGRELKIVTQTIEKFIPEYSNLRVTRIPTPHMLVEKNGETIRLDQLSDGEKNMIAMVGDIARRLSMANPNLENPLEGDGIVMIDEVDLHLHPRWQQKILVNLKKAFPNIQFIVTTHSPQVLTTVESKGIQGLVYENGQMYIEKFDFSLGAKSNEVLNRILGIDERPQNLDIVKKLNRYLELVDKNLYDKEEAITLRKELDAWGAGKEKELSKIDMDIRLKEYQRKKYEKS